MSGCGALWPIMIGTVAPTLWCGGVAPCDGLGDRDKYHSCTDTFSHITSKAGSRFVYLSESASSGYLV